MIDEGTLIQLAREYPDITPSALSEHCKALARQSKRHHSLAERECNEPDFDLEAINRCERSISAMLGEWFPGTWAQFSRDPRGATVKLVVPSGATNDWGREGLVVLA